MTLADTIIGELKNLKLSKKTLLAIQSVVAEQKRKEIYKELGLTISDAPRWVLAPVPQDHLRDTAGEREEQEI